jgi:hypothetical protein
MTGVISRFGVWFASAGGVLQTFAFCMAVVVLELIFPAADPHMFWWLVILTVYSGVTQPVLAYVGMTGARKTDEVLAKLEALESDELAQLIRLRDALTAGEPGRAVLTANGTLEVRSTDGIRR